jgi:hypothetical protein
VLPDIPEISVAKKTIWGETDGSNPTVVYIKMQFKNIYNYLRKEYEAIAR